MKFKIPKGTETFNRLMFVQKKMKAAKAASGKLCKELGAKDVYTNGHNAAGGIDALSFETNPDRKYWRTAGKSWQNLWYPRSTANDLLAKIKALPIVDIEEINKIIGFKSGFVDGDGVNVFMVHVKGPSLNFKKQFILMDIHDKIKFIPNKDMEEILNSEYNKLSQSIK